MTATCASCHCPTQTDLPIRLCPVCFNLGRLGGHEVSSFVRAEPFRHARRKGA